LKICKQKEYVNDLFIHIIMSLVNQTKTNGDTMEGHWIIKKVLRSISSKFDPIVVSIEESKNLTQMSLEELTGSLQTHKQKLYRFVAIFFNRDFRSPVSMKSGGRSSNYRYVAKQSGS